eukprot:703577-Prymnesium_polylepis.2
MYLCISHPTYTDTFWTLIQQNFRSDQTEPRGCATRPGHRSPYRSACEPVQSKASEVSGAAGRGAGGQGLVRGCQVVSLSMAREVGST